MELSLGKFEILVWDVRLIGVMFNRTSLTERKIHSNEYDEYKQALALLGYFSNRLIIAYIQAE